MRTTLIALSLLAASLSPSQAQARDRDHLDVGIGIGVRLPSVSIGLALPAAPVLVQVPGQPVFYAPGASANYFYADGAYWVLRGDRWYSSAWYDGPWQLVTPEYVPSIVLRVPVRYYRHPPPYFSGWHRDRSPRWGEHWGRGWERHRDGWDRWDHRPVGRLTPPPARRHDDGRGHGRDDDRGRDRDDHRGRGRGHGGDRDQEGHGRAGR
jgi:hypothetical protein